MFYKKLKSISEKEALDVQAPITHKEVGNFIKSKCLDKASRITGANVEYYKFLWNL